MNLTPQAAAEELLRRRQARRSFRTWCQVIGLEPAKHHDLMISKLQEVAESPVPRYIILLMPPGAAKSTYSSKAYIPWYLGFKPASCVLACSYSKDLAVSFGRNARNYVDVCANVLGYKLSSDTKAADEWETSTGGRYFCAGVGGGIAGHRADLGLIDDYLGNQEDADSKTVRDKQWAWFKQDFYPRLKPLASVVIIANRRHEQDLVGMLLKEKENDSPIPPEKWEVIRLPFFAKDNDVLGRVKGERLWPEWFTEQQAAQVARMSPRILSGLYQQEPTPEEGDFFKREWLIGYESQDLPEESEMRVYAASDHAISQRDEGNKSCFGAVGVDSEGTVWLLPEIFWERADAEQQCNAMLNLTRNLKPQRWRVEKGHISQALGPFLNKRMRETGIYIPLHEYTPKRDKPTRARSIQGLLALGRVRVPKFAPWWGEAEHQLLTFPASEEDDFVDMFAHLGNQIDTMTQPSEEVLIEAPTSEPTLTYGWVRKSSERHRKSKLVYD